MHERQPSELIVTELYLTAIVGIPSASLDRDKAVE